MFPIYILPIFIYLIYSKHLWTKKLCWSFCTNDRSWNHFFWVLRDSRTGISAIFNRLAYRLNDVFTKVCLYQLFGHPMNCNLNQSDEKSDQPGILGLDDPFYIFLVALKSIIGDWKRRVCVMIGLLNGQNATDMLLWYFMHLEPTKNYC